MSRCKVHWKNEKELLIEGVMDETCQFDSEVARFGTEVWVDFHGVSRINSCGVRQWTKAVHLSQARVHYINSPTLIVDQFSMVPEFMGPNGTVDSFESRYVCESCENEETAVLKVGQDIQPGLEEYCEGPSRKCSRCGAHMTFDHNPEVYLDFLRVLKKAG